MCIAQHSNGDIAIIVTVLSGEDYITFLMPSTVNTTLYL